MGDVAVGYCRSLQVDIADLMTIAGVEASADVPTVQGVESYIERGSAIGAPVAVVVVWTRDAATGILFVGHDIADRVSGTRKAAVGTEAPVALVLGHHETQTILHQRGFTLHLEVGAEVGGERRLQAWVTHGDRERVGVVVDIEQLGDVWLLGLSAELHLQVGVLIETIAQIEGGGKVDNGTHGVNRLSQILLDIMGPTFILDFSREKRSCTSALCPYSERSE